jgi:hypothetical protein
MTVPIHLTEGDYDKLFPDDVDQFPTVINEQHYIDAWLLNTVFSSLLITEQYLLDHKGNIESAIGADIIGADGQLEIEIPSAFYPPYKFVLAWDSNLLAENIKSGETIFGVAGSCSVAAGGLAVGAAVCNVIPILFPSTISLDAAMLAVPVPTTNVV